MIIKGYEVDHRSDKFPTDAQIREEGTKWGLPLHRLKSELSSLVWQEEKDIQDYMESIRGRGVTVGGAEPHIKGIRREYSLKKLEAEDPNKIDEGWSDDMKLALCAKRELLIKKDGHKIPAMNFWDFESGMPQFVRQLKIEQDKKKDAMQNKTMVGLINVTGNGAKFISNEFNGLKVRPESKHSLRKVIGILITVILGLGGTVYYLLYIDNVYIFSNSINVIFRAVK